MNNREKEIIGKLISIAQNQQKVIHKLAETLDADPNVAYLKRAVDSVIANSGVRVPYNVYVQTNPASTHGNVQLEATYTVNVSGLNKLDETTKQKFLNTFNTQIKSQKPNLDGKVSILFV